MGIRPFVSIGLSLCNGDRFLEATLDSLRNQTFKNLEIVISDDCSTDHTERICRRYAARDVRIRYYRTAQPIGPARNAQRVLALAEGKYFKQAVQAEMMQPDFLRLCLNALETDDSLVLAYSLVHVIDEDGLFLENYDEPLRVGSPDAAVRVHDLLLRAHAGYPIAGLVRLDTLRALPPQESLAPSARLTLLQLGLLGRFYEVPEHLLFMTRHAAQAARHPAQAGGLVAPAWKVALALLRSINSSSLDRRQQLRCYASIARWAVKSRRGAGLLPRKAGRSAAAHAATIGSQAKLWQNADMACGLQPEQSTQHEDAGVGMAT